MCLSNLHFVAYFSLKQKRPKYMQIVWADLKWQVWEFPVDLHQVRFSYIPEGKFSDTSHWNILSLTRRRDYCDFNLNIRHKQKELPQKQLTSRTPLETWSTWRKWNWTNMDLFPLMLKKRKKKASRGWNKWQTIWKQLCWLQSSPIMYCLLGLNPWHQEVRKRYKMCSHADCC
jgi:hypothetical protein